MATQKNTSWSNEEVQTFLYLVAEESIHIHLHTFLTIQAHPVYLLNKLFTIMLYL